MGAQTIAWQFACLKRGRSLFPATVARVKFELWVFLIINFLSGINKVFLNIELNFEYCIILLNQVNLSYDVGNSC